METLIIEATDETPKIVLDQSKMLFEISGRSLPEDVVCFYQPVMDWMDKLESEPIENMEFCFKLEYFNTASSKLILDIFLKLDEIYQDGNKINVKWYFSELDEDLEEAGEEYSELIEIPFELIAIKTSKTSLVA